MERRFFTVSEANGALPRLSDLLRALQEKFRWLDGNRQQISYLVAEYNVVNESPVDPEYFRALMSIRGALREVEQIGAHIKDIKGGLVDFPARRHGRDVLLCWRLGEDRVGYWHDMESGFAGRQPLESEEVDAGAGEKGN
ncbi:MAG TPA: DUF2203 domain-containing protein [Candidatus Polarisedimenticolia bacterium]|jgi:hypothetical protein